MRIPYFEVSAFTQNVFGGNPAGVCPLMSWPDDKTLQGIAANNNLAETAFTAPRGEEFDLRWFTPTVEVDLCGHATLAAAFVLFNCTGLVAPEIRFHTRSGRLTVSREGDWLTLDFPARPGIPEDAPADLVRGLGAAPIAVVKARDYLAVFDSESEVRAVQPDFGLLKKLDCLGIIITAPGSNCDFVSRFFAPAGGVDEDPVTGSAHCTLIPYWAQRLGKQKLMARQVSARGGELACELMGDRVRIGGKAVLYLRGEIQLEDARRD